jgi:hypothetical protein
MNNPPIFTPTRPNDTPGVIPLPFEPITPF